MQAVSNVFKRLIAANSSLVAEANIYFPDGTYMGVPGSRIKELSYEQATSSDQTFDIGAAVVGKMDVTLDNFDHSYDSRDFTGAEVEVTVGIERDGVTYTLEPDDVVIGPNDGHFDDSEPRRFSEYLNKGRYVVQQPDVYGDDIRLTCYDYLYKLSVTPFEKAPMSYPATLYDAAEACCSPLDGGYQINLACSKAAYKALNSIYVGMSEQPDDSGWNVVRLPDELRDGSGTSCLQVLSWAAQAAGCYVRATNHKFPSIYVGWYDLDAFDRETWLDGGTFSTPDTPYSDGDVADGGTFDTTTIPYSDGYVADGGRFGGYGDAKVITKFSSLTTSTDDVVITGISVTAQNEVKVGDDGSESNGADGETALAGTTGYVLSVTGNPFVPYGTAERVAKSLYAAVGGMRFRTFDCTCAPDPSVEPGDPVIIQDRIGRVFKSYVTRVNMTVNGQMTLSCGGATPARNSSMSASAATQAIVAARKDLVREMTSREAEEQRLNDAMSESSGLYQTVETLADGSKVYYMHDKPELSSSKVIWKMNSGAIAVSTDGGATYSTGLTADGTAIVDRLYAHGFDADRGTVGTLKSRSGSTSWNLDTGEFTGRLKAGTTLEGNAIATTSDVSSSVSSAKSDVTSVNATNQQRVFNQLTNGGGAQGIYLSNGRVYINGEYIKAGTITTVGANGTGVEVSGATLKFKTGGNENASFDTSHQSFSMTKRTVKDDGTLDSSATKTTYTGYGRLHANAFVIDAKAIGVIKNGVVKPGITLNDDLMTNVKKIQIVDGLVIGIYYEVGGGGLYRYTWSFGESSRYIEHPV